MLLVFAYTCNLRPHLLYRAREEPISTYQVKMHLAIQSVLLSATEESVSKVDYLNFLLLYFNINLTLEFYHLQDILDRNMTVMMVNNSGPMLLLKVGIADKADCFIQKELKSENSF